MDQRKFQPKLPRPIRGNSSRAGICPRRHHRQCELRSVLRLLFRHDHWHVQHRWCRLPVQLLPTQSQASMSRGSRKPVSLLRLPDRPAGLPAPPLSGRRDILQRLCRQNNSHHTCRLLQCGNIWPLQVETRGRGTDAARDFSTCVHKRQADRGIRSAEEELGNISVRCPDGVC